MKVMGPEGQASSPLSPADLFCSGMTRIPPEAITLHGAWRGSVNDPDRTFEGKVAASGHPGIRRGSRAQVHFGHSAVRSHNADEHGTYTLRVGQHDIPLMSFTCRTVGTTGEHGDDTQTADWHALPLKK